MPSVVHMLGLVVVAAVTVGTLAIYYALNGGEQFQFVEADARRRRRRNNALQLPIQERPDQRDRQNQRDPDDCCGICSQNIQNAEYDLTTLPCNHNFHCRCISDHLHRTAAANDALQSACPICGAPYSFENIF